MLKKLDVLFLSVAVFLSFPENALQANEKPQEAMDRVRLFSINILEKSLQSENALYAVLPRALQANQNIPDSFLS